MSETCLGPIESTRRAHRATLAVLFQVPGCASFTPVPLSLIHVAATISEDFRLSVEFQLDAMKL